MNTANTSGRLVVDKVVAAVNGSGLFPDDHGLMKRIAWVESKFGTDPRTYKLGYHGGIWQVSWIHVYTASNIYRPICRESVLNYLYSQHSINW